MTNANKTAEELAVELAQLLDCDGAINENGIALIEQALLAAEQRAQQGWRDISTAPGEDEGSFLVWAKHRTDEGFSIVQASWFEGRLYADSRECVIDYDDGLQAIYWQPLLAAPNTPDAGITARKVTEAESEALRAALLNSVEIVESNDYQRGFADGVAKVVSYHKNQFQYYSRMNQHHYADWHLICANTIEAKNMGEPQ